MGVLTDAYLKPLVRRAAGVVLNLARDGGVDYAFVSLKARIGRGVVISAGARVDFACSIGSHSFIGFNSFVTRASIGRYCSIANGVTIGPGEHTLDRLSSSSLFYDAPFESLTSAPCTLGNDVWLGNDAIIRRGVKVGDGAIVGANSFVREDVQPFAVVAGSPAKLIRFRFTEEQRARIESSGWWDLEIEEARQAILRLEVELGLRVSTSSK